MGGDLGSVGTTSRGCNPHGLVVRALCLGAEMKRAKLLSECIELIKTFNPATTTIDAHCDDRLGDVSHKEADPDKVFMKQVFYPMRRHPDPLRRASPRCAAGLVQARRSCC